jgi:hypothetical protein
MAHIDQNGNVTEEFAEWIVKVAAGVPNFTLNETTIRVYARCLSDLTIQQLGTAAYRCLRQKDFFPSIAELVRQVEPSADDAAMVAWTSLAQAASTGGAYASCEFADVAAAVAVQTVFGSWPAVCELAGEGPAWAQKRAEFLAAYRIARQSNALQKGPVRLPGLCEASGAVLPDGALVLVGKISARGQVTTEPERLQIGAPRDTPLLASAKTGEAQEDEGQSETGRSDGQDEVPS